MKVREGRVDEIITEPSPTHGERKQ
jgi:hypothetical protein